ncbi:MAG: TetR/AcrR family transcriptional regulator [Armatimonadetes bacterium]|nr:TetR/AcrR family transcriptional regulator [Akkermansiaceae bacterium]
MRVLKVPETGAKRKLLDAAEALVAKKGFDGVSVRDVTGAIKANVAAVNYHFGSREGLMDLVMMKSLGPLCKERAKTLDGLGKTASVEALVSAYVRAVLTTAGTLEMEPEFFLCLVGRVQVIEDGNLPELLSLERKNVSHRYLKSLARALPEMDPAELAMRWDFFESGLGQALLSVKSKDNAPDLLECWSRFGVLGLSGDHSVDSMEGGQGMLFEL